MPEFSFEDVGLFLPKYLSPSQQQSLFDEIKRFPAKVSYYTPPSAIGVEDMLQGDGWRGLIAIDFDTLEKKPVSGIIISNSCDIVAENAHDHSPNVLFAPIVKLDSFLNLLRDAGKSAQDVNAKADVIRKQAISSLFYLPKYEGVMEDSIVVLDDIHRHPLQHFLASTRIRLFRLTQFAFYLFVIKLSIHLHRLNEGVARYLPASDNVGA